MGCRLKILGIWIGLIFFFVPVTVPAARLLSLTTCEQVLKPDFTPVNKRDQFPPDTREIHAIAILDQVRTGARIKGVWVAVDAIQTPNYEIDSTEVQAQEEGEIKIDFRISGPEKGWPVGNYRFDLYLHGRLFAAIPFSILTEEVIRPVKPSAGFDLGPVRTDRNRIWTVVVYLDGDNDLEPFALKDIDEMERSLPASGVDIIVLIDRAEGYSDADGNWTDARIYRIRQDSTEGIKSELLASPGELNMGNPSVLQGFLTSALRTFPAKHHALILWNHGGGWAAHVTDEKAPGAPQEEDKLTLPELRQAVSEALREAGLKKLDLIGFDMCLMGQIETAYEIEALADVMVGSEAVEPGDGWPYDTVIPLFGNQALSSRDIAKGIVKAFDDFYRGKQEPFTTQSAFDLGAISDVVKAFNGLLDKLDGALPEIWPSLARSLFFSEGYGDLGDMRRANQALLSIDLGDAFKNLADVVPALRSAPEYTAFNASLNRLVLESRSSPRHRKSQGVALYAPFRQDLYNQEYEKTRFAQNSRWPGTLKQLYAIQAKNPDRPMITTIQTVSLLRKKQVGEVIQLGQDGFLFDFEGKNILWAFASLGVRDEANRRTLIFEKSLLYKASEEEFLRSERKGREELLRMYSYSDGAHSVGFRYDGTRKVVSNGKTTFPATMDESNVGNLGAHIIAVPAILEHPKVGKRFATIYFNWLWQAAAVRLEIEQKDGSFVYAQVKPPPEADIHLLVEALPDQGERKYVITGSLKWGDGLFLTLDLAPPREYEVFLTIESLTGLSNTLRHRFSVAARDDDLLKNVKDTPEEMIAENFLGEWELVDAETWFKQGRMVSIGAFARYEPHPKHKGLLKLTLYKPKGREVYPGLDVVEVIERVGLPHLRQYVLDQEGNPQADYGYRMAFPVFDYKDGQYLLLSMDLATGEMGVKVKRSGPTPRLKMPGAQVPAGPSPGAVTPPAATPSSVDGMWVRGRETLVIQGSQWAFLQGGQLNDRGFLVIRGNQLTSQSQFTGEVQVYLFKVEENRLLLQDSTGQIHQFTRSR